MKAPVSFSNDERTFDGLPAAVVQNRFWEKTPSQSEGSAMLARPGTSVVGDFGDGPIRAIYSQTGLHDSALFFVSGDTLFRRNTDGTTITINGVVYGDSTVSMTPQVGPGFERLFIADGSHLQFYAGGTHATGVLTGVTANVSDGDVVQIGDTYYRWTATVGSGAGTVSDPWDVLLGADLAGSLSNMAGAINFVGTPGTDFSANLGGQNTQVTATSTATSMTVTARTDLAAGNSIVTLLDSADTVPAVSWGAGALAGGGTHGLSGVEVPDGLPPVSLATLKGYVIVAIGSSDRFYWLQPGEVVIDALDFATAESQPDDVNTVTVVGDTVWFIGDGSTEVWYPTGDLQAPFAPVSGRVYDRGAIEGTVVNIKGVVFLVGNDYVVYGIGGSAERVSTHGVEQTIRESLA